VTNQAATRRKEGRKEGRKVSDSFPRNKVWSTYTIIRLPTYTIGSRPRSMRCVRRKVLRIGDRTRGGYQCGTVLAAL
jgi:hypothetical protein